VRQACWGRINGSGLHWPVPRGTATGFLDKPVHDFDITLPTPTDDPLTSNNPTPQRFIFDLDPFYYVANTGGGTLNSYSENSPPPTQIYNSPGDQSDCRVRYPEIPNWENAADYMIQNRDYYIQAGNGGPQITPTNPFNGMTGTGFGPHDMRPPTCVSNPMFPNHGVAYWNTDRGNWNKSGVGGQGTLDMCVNNQWVDDWYVPFEYPHPLNDDPPDSPHMIFSQPPTQIVNGFPFAPPMGIRVRPIPTPSNSIQLSATGCNLSGQLQQATDAQGDIVFTGVAATAASIPTTCTITATNLTNTTMPAITSAAFNLVAPPPDVTVMSFSPPLTSATFGVAVNPSIQLTPPFEHTLSMQVASGNCNMTPSLATATANASGVATFPNVIFRADATGPCEVRVTNTADARVPPLSQTLTVNVPTGPTGAMEVVNGGHAYGCAFRVGGTTMPLSMQQNGMLLDTTGADLLVAVVSVGTGHPPTMSYSVGGTAHPLTWTQVFTPPFSNSNLNATQYVFYAHADQGGPSAVITATTAANSLGNMCAVAIHGWNGMGPVIQTGSGSAFPPPATNLTGQAGNFFALTMLTFLDPQAANVNRPVGWDGPNALGGGGGTFGAALAWKTPVDEVETVPWGVTNGVSIVASIVFRPADTHLPPALVFTQEPTTTTTGAPFTPAIQVQVPQ
jgi:hypothetical protein